MGGHTVINHQIIHLKAFTRNQVQDINLLYGIFDLISQWQPNHPGLNIAEIKENCIDIFHY